MREACIIRANPAVSDVGVLLSESPERVSARQDELAELLLGRGDVQLGQVAHEDALELHAVAAAAVGVSITDLPQDSVLGELLDGGRGDVGGVLEELARQN